MILTRSAANDTPKYWLIKDNLTASPILEYTIKQCFSALSKEDLFDISKQYEIRDNCIYDKSIDTVTDLIIATFPDCTYEEFCQQYPELLI